VQVPAHLPPSVSAASPSAAAPSAPSSAVSPLKRLPSSLPLPLPSPLFETMPMLSPNAQEQQQQQQQLQAQHAPRRQQGPPPVSALSLTSALFSPFADDDPASSLLLSGGPSVGGIGVGGGAGAMAITPLEEEFTRNFPLPSSTPTRVGRQGRQSLSPGEQGRTLAAVADGDGSGPAAAAVPLLPPASSGAGGLGGGVGPRGLSASSFGAGSSPFYDTADEAAGRPDYASFLR